MEGNRKYIKVPEDKQIILFEYDLIDYERSFGLEGFIPETPPKNDTKDLMIQRLIANVRLLKEMVNKLTIYKEE